MKCQNCGFEITQGELFCGNCGSKINSSVSIQKKYCGNCGSEMGPNEIFCGVCGVSAVSENKKDDYKPKRKQSSILIIIISVILIAIIAASAVIIYMITEKQDDEADNIGIVNSSKADSEPEADMYNNDDDKHPVNETNLYNSVDSEENGVENKSMEIDESITSNNEDIPLGYDDMSDGYLFPGDTEYITVEYLSTLTKGEIGLIRNEIFARHGYIFETEEYSNYFKGKSWYKPDQNFDASTLSEIERTNVNTILAYEKQMGWR